MLLRVDLLLRGHWRVRLLSNNHGCLMLLTVLVEKGGSVVFEVDCVHMLVRVINFDAASFLTVTNLSKSCIKRVFGVSSKILLVDFGSDWICCTLSSVAHFLWAVLFVKLPPAWIDHTDLLLLFKKAS